MDRRLLTPAEAVLLLAPSTGTAPKCVQAGLLSLLGGERIAFEQSASLIQQSAVLINRGATLDPVPLPQHLVLLEQALVSYGKNRLISSEVLHSLQKRFGIGYGRYVTRLHRG